MKPWPFHVRPVAAAAHDGLALSLACFGAAMLVDGNGLSVLEFERIISALAIAIPLQLVVNVFIGVYHGVWRYTSLPDI